MRCDVVIPVVVLMQKSLSKSFGFQVVVDGFECACLALALRLIGARLLPRARPLLAAGAVAAGGFRLQVLFDLAHLCFVVALGQRGLHQVALPYRGRLRGLG